MPIRPFLSTLCTLEYRRDMTSRRVSCPEESEGSVAYTASVEVSCIDVLERKKQWDGRPYQYQCPKRRLFQKIYAIFAY
jgi:hypothetical protein